MSIKEREEEELKILERRKEIEVGVPKTGGAERPSGPQGDVTFRTRMGLLC